MRRLVAVAAVAVAAACSAPNPAGPDMVAPLYVTSTHALEPGSNSGTHLSGDHEVPARDTRAQGQVTFRLEKNGTELSYRLNVANIFNVRQAHIHIGSPTINGPITVFLFGLVAAGGGRVDGVLATGTITSADFIGPLVGKTMADLITEIRNGNAYVNVHTDDGIAPTNTGPGDFPGGEIRGQVRVTGR